MGAKIFLPLLLLLLVSLPVVSLSLYPAGVSRVKVSTRRGGGGRAGVGFAVGAYVV